MRGALGLVARRGESYSANPPCTTSTARALVLGALLISCTCLVFPVTVPFTGEKLRLREGRARPTFQTGCWP